jgi:hypothetical protein
MLMPLTALLVLQSHALNSPAAWKKTAWDHDAWSQRVPAYLQQNRKVHLALVQCSACAVRLQGTRGEKTNAAFSLRTSTLPAETSPAVLWKTDFYSTGPAKFKAGEYYLLLLAQNTDGNLEPQPLINAAFQIADNTYQVVDYLWVSGRDANSAYDREVKKIPATAPTGAGQGRQGAAKTLTYRGITFTAPNAPGRAYYVFAVKDGKTLWETAKDIATPEPANAPIKNEVLELAVKEVADHDLDQGADNYAQMKSYVGKPALYIKDASTSSPLPSWRIIDINTGASLGGIAFN